MDPWAIWFGPMGTRFVRRARHLPHTPWRGPLHALLVTTLTATPALAAPKPIPAPPAPAAPAATPAPVDDGSSTDPATDLALAEKQYANLDYDHANLVAAKVLAAKGLTHDQLLRALRVLSLTDAALGHEDQAREEFVELLTYAADFQVDPNLGPRVTAPFLEARGFWRAQPQRPGVEILASVHASGPGTLRVITRDPTHIVKKGTVGFRWGSSDPYTTAPLAVSGPGDGIAFDIPERTSNAPRLDYFAQVFDERGDAVMEVGNPTSPKSVIVEAPKVVAASKPTILSSPIFWTVAAVVVAGAATTAILLSQPKAPTGAGLKGGAECNSGGTPMMCQ
jgi:hypothetical protein